MSRRNTRRPCRRWIPAAGTLLCALGLVTPGVAAAQPPTWTLDAALESAFAHSPRLRAAKARLAQADGRLLTARTYPHNPELSLQVAERRGEQRSSTDFGFSLSQEVEIAGQRRLRTGVAQSQASAVGADWQRWRRRFAFEVEAAFVAALRARELLRVDEADAELTRQALAFARRRLERGAGTQIEVNLAQAVAGRAQRRSEQSRAEYAAACSRLAELAGADPAVPPRPLGELDVPTGDVPLVASLVRQALQARGDLQSARHSRRSAELELRLASTQRWPRLQVGSFFEREERTDEIFGLTLGFSLPLFDRGQGRVAEARARRDERDYQVDALRLAVELQVVAAAERLRAALETARYLRSEVLATLEENLDLLHKSLEAGRISGAELVTLRREFIDSQREYVDVLAQARLARLELDLAVGITPVPEINEVDVDDVETQEVPR